MCVMMDSFGPQDSDGPAPADSLSSEFRPKAKRWSAQRKAEVVAAVEAGALSLEQACGRYQLTAEEFASWQDAISRHGVSGLKAKALEERRKAPRRALN